MWNGLYSDGHGIVQRAVETQKSETPFGDLAELPGIGPGLAISGTGAERADHGRSGSGGNWAHFGLADELKEKHPQRLHVGDMFRDEDDEGEGEDVPLTISMHMSPEPLSSSSSSLGPRARSDCSSDEGAVQGGEPGDDREIAGETTDSSGPRGSSHESGSESGSEVDTAKDTAGPRTGAESGSESESGIGEEDEESGGGKGGGLDGLLMVVPHELGRVRWDNSAA